jgi:hypothetical protein
MSVSSEEPPTLVFPHLRKKIGTTQTYPPAYKAPSFYYLRPRIPSNVASTPSGASQALASVRDAEKAGDPAAKTADEKLEIEHVLVDDDPKKWSNMQKVSPMIYFATSLAIRNRLSSPTWHLDRPAGRDHLHNNGCLPRCEHIHP